MPVIWVEQGQTHCLWETSYLH